VGAIAKAFELCAKIAAEKQRAALAA
jgi:hypothetical protein